jgi:ELWxxDGT repeat protein
MTKAVFAGYDASGHRNLWETDGTAAGTSELTVTGTYSGGLLDNGRVPAPHFTVFGSKILFEGLDAFSQPNLWVTDGTSAGTSALTTFPAFFFVQQ